MCRRRLGARGARRITSTSPEGRLQVMTLDALGRIVISQIGNLAPSTTVYNPRGRVASVTQGSGTTARTSTFAWDSAKIDQLVSMTDPLGRTTAFHYDATGRVDQQTLPDGAILASTFDASSNLTSLTPPGKPAHTFGYNAIDLETLYTPPAIASTASLFTQYSYDLDRALTVETRPGGAAITRTYDSAGRLVSLAHPLGRIDYAFEPATGRLASVTATGAGTIAYGHDGRLVTSETLTGGPVSGVLRRAFDDDFREVSESVDGGTPILMTFDRDNLLVSAGDEVLSREAVTGNISATTLGNIKTAHTYNSFGEPARDIAEYVAVTLYDAVYDDGGANPRDALGRLQRFSETVQGVTHSYDYVYDTRDRLRDVQIDGFVTRSYTFDENGNRLSKTDGAATTWYVYDAQDRLLCERFTSGTDCLTSVAVLYAWTPGGNLATRTDAGGMARYQYDEVGNLRVRELLLRHLQIFVDMPDRPDEQAFLRVSNHQSGAGYPSLQ